MFYKTKNNRRDFIKKTSGLLSALGITTYAHAASVNPVQEATEVELGAAPPDNPLVLFDNFHVGNRRSYPWRAKFAAARSAGFDGFEFAGVDTQSDNWKMAMDLVPDTDFSVWGFHWTTRSVVDRFADSIEQEIEKIIGHVEVCGASPLKPYFTLSLSGNDELRGPTIAESGSAKAEERHWKRAYRIIAAFDKACRENGVRGSLYPHTHWICDTPQSQVRILEGAAAQTIGPAFCAHHWYANKRAAELEEVLALPIMERLNYVVLTNGRFNGNQFPAVRFDTGEIDMAWILAKIMEFGYQGPISSQGWAIGGDPYVSCKAFVDGVTGLRHRFKTQPELWPLG